VVTVNAKASHSLPCSSFFQVRRGVLTVSASAHFHNLQLQKSPSRVFGQNSGNPIEISKAFFELGIWKFESSQVSQAVTQLEIVGPTNPISARQLRLFVNLLSVSILPRLNNLSAKLPIVSSPNLKYYRFLETQAGDPVRSALRGVGAVSLNLHRPRSAFRGRAFPFSERLSRARTSH
jgi:hypothetical protein